MDTLLRRIDRARRRVMFPLVQLLLRNRRRVSLPLDRERIQRILVIRDDGLGDAIATLPMIRLLRHWLPHARIDIWCSHRNVQVFAALSEVSHVWVWHGDAVELLDLVRSLRRERYDLALLTVRNKSTTHALFMRAIVTSAAFRAASYRGDKYQWHFDIHSHVAARAENEWDATVNLIAEIFSDIPTNQDLQPFFPRVEYSWRIAQEHCQTLGLASGEYVVINLSAHQECNRWSDTQLRETLGALCSHGLQLLACGITADIDRYKSLLTEFNIPWYPPTRDIHQIAGIIAHARCVITPDTGVLHLATALGTPLVGIYRSDGHNEHYWAPYRHPFAVQLIAEHGKLAYSIPAERIVDATLALLHQCQPTGANAVS